MRFACLFLMACIIREQAVPLHRIAGRIIAPSSVGVVVVTLDNLLLTTTDALGDFRFDDVPDGRYTLTVQPTFATREGVQGRGVDVAGADVTGLLFTLTPTSRVQGYVLDEDGEPVAGARVFAAGTAAVAYSQEDGSYALDQVPLGTYAIVAQASGYLLAREERQVGPLGAGLTFFLESDPSADDNRPNEAPVITALTFYPRDNHNDNPRVIPAASLEIPALVHAGSSIEIAVEATDPEGEPLSFLWSADKGALEGGDRPLVYWTAPSSEAEVLVTVVDPHGNTATARQRFVLPARSLRGAAVYGHEVIYSETRANDDRDLIGYDLVTGAERTVYAAADEQHAPRIVGDMLVFADQVFTFVQPLVFRVHMLGLGPLTGTDSSLGQTLTPNDNFLIDYKLYSPLTDGRITYFSQSSQLAPLGVGVLEPVAGSYAPFTALGTSPTPAYPCFVVHAGAYYGVNSMSLYRYGASSSTLLASIPGRSCLEMQAKNGRIAMRTDDVFSPLVVVTLAGATVQRLGAQVGSFVMHGDWVAYTDKRGSVTGVYLHNFATHDDVSVATSGFSDRRVLDLTDETLVFTESDPDNQVSPYSSDTLLVFRLQ